MALRVFYRIFLKGLLTLLPITVTIYLVVWLATQTEHLFAGPLQTWFPTVFSFPGSGFLVGLLLVFTVGLAVNSYFTKRFFQWLEERIEQVPLIRSIYSPLRDVTNLFAEPRDNQAHPQRVVMVEIGGVEMLGLVTRDNFSDLPAGSVPLGTIAVFIPYSYGMGGMTVIVPRTRVRETQIPAERAMQLAITGWVKASK